jgi:hypothetical protein
LKKIGFFYSYFTILPFSFTSFVIGFAIVME